MAFDKNDPEAIEWLEEETKEYRAKISKLLDEKKKLQKSILSGEEIAEAEKLRDALESKEDEFKALKKNFDALTKKYTTEIDSHTTKTKNLTAKLEQTLLDAAAMKAINEEGGNVDLLMPHVRNRMALVEDNGDYVVKVRDAKGEFADFDAFGLVKEFKSNANFGAAFKATITPGGGAKPGATMAATFDNPYAPATYNMTKQAMLESTDRPLADRLKAEAGIK